MSRNLKAFRDDLLRTLGSDNVILIYHHGSQARGEARSDSDYDTILILNEIDEKVLQKTRDARAIICCANHSLENRSLKKFIEKLQKSFPFC